MTAELAPAGSLSVLIEAPGTRSKPPAAAPSVTEAKMIIKLGTEAHRCHAEDVRWLAKMDNASRERVSLQGVDTANLWALLDLGRSQCLQIRVPKSMSLVLDQREDYPDLSTALMGKYVPTTKDDGASIARNDAFVALANDVERVRAFLWEGLRSALNIPHGGYHAAAMRLQATVILETFAGGNTGSALTIPVAMLLRDLAREKAVDLYLAAHMTLPDQAPGFDGNVLVSRKANATALLLELAALDEMETFRTTIGGRELQPRQPLFDEIVLYSQISPAGVTTRVDDLTHTMGQAVRLQLQDGIGVGTATRLQRVRLIDVLHRPAPFSKHCATFSAYGYGELALDRRLMAEAFANRSTLELLRGLSSAAADRGPSLISQLTGGSEPRAWYASLRQDLTRDLPPLVGQVRLTMPVENQQLNALEGELQTRWQQQLAQLQTRAGNLQSRLQQALNRLTLQAMADGYVPSLAANLNHCRGSLLQLANAEPTTAESEANTRAENTKRALVAARRPREEQAQQLITAHEQALQARFAAQREATVAALLSQMLRKLGELLQEWAQGASLSLQEIERVTAAGGALDTQEREHPVWRDTASTRPNERFALSSTEAGRLYDQLQAVSGSTGHSPSRESLCHWAAQLEASNRSWAFLQGRVDDLADAARQYFLDHYLKVLAAYDIASVIRSIYGSLTPLKKRLQWAFTVARGALCHIDIGSRVRHLHHHTVVEVGSADPELIDLLRRASSDQWEQVHATRGDTDAVIVQEAIHGLHLDLLPEFRKHGSFREAYVQRQADWLARRGPPVHTCQETQALVRDRFPEIAAEVDALVARSRSERAGTHRPKRRPSEPAAATVRRRG